MKRKIHISGIAFQYENSVKEIGPQIVEQIKTLSETLSKIEPQYNDLKKKVGKYKTQLDSLSIYVKDMFPELSVNVKSEATAETPNS